MDIGLLWYDDDPKKTLEAKVGEAANRYLLRCRAIPNACHVHRPPEDATQRQSLTLTLPNGGHPLKAAVVVIPDRAIRPHYFWIGLEKKP